VVYHNNTNNRLNVLKSMIKDLLCIKLNIINILGPVVWYQQFEYAVGHWLQKAAEHVFGCVLCCPGAFSLFRATSLMDDNVMKMYTSPPLEARHFIQYEQGMI
jgi:cellulose synthase/poly-beta-1,6-N-acetylglucosamine synthase-like glycosyltransferase